MRSGLFHRHEVGRNSNAPCIIAERYTEVHRLRIVSIGFAGKIWNCHDGRVRGRFGGIVKL